MSYETIDDIWKDAKDVASKCEECSVEKLDVSIKGAKKYEFCKKHHREFYSRYENEEYSSEGHKNEDLENLSVSELVSRIKNSADTTSEFSELEKRLEQDSESVEKELFGKKSYLRKIIEVMPFVSVENTVSDLITNGFHQSRSVEILARKYPDKMVNYSDEIAEIVENFEDESSHVYRIQGLFILSIGYIGLENNLGSSKEVLENVAINNENKEYINLALSLASIKNDIKKERGLMHDEREFLDPAKYEEEIIRAAIVYLGHNGDKEDLEIIELMDTPKRSLGTKKEIEKARNRILD